MCLSFPERGTEGLLDQLDSSLLLCVVLSHIVQRKEEICGILLEVGT